MYRFNAVRQRATLLALGLLAMLAPCFVPGTSGGPHKRQAADKDTAASMPQFEVTDLGALPLVADNVMLSLNAQGQVALWKQGTGTTVRAVLWANGKLQDLGEAQGYPCSIGRGINDEGEVVGWKSSSANPVDSQATTHATLFQQGHLQDLGTLGGRDSQAFATNGRHHIVGIAGLANGARHGFRYNGQAMVDLGTLPGGTFSAAYAINAAGEIVGTAETAVRTNHAVLWKQDKITDLGTLAGGPSSTALAINQHGVIVGYAETDADVHGFLYTNGKMTDVGTLEDYPTVAAGINNSGQVVGASTVERHHRHAFLWQNGHMHDLNKCIPKDSDWTIRDAYAINNAGQIVCKGVHKGGSPHALLLNPVPMQRRTP